ncbi:MAG: hypothetical protein AAF203_08105 [Pseudomonadota bacterium]
MKIIVLLISLVFLMTACGPDSAEQPLVDPANPNSLTGGKPTTVIAGGNDQGQEGGLYLSCEPHLMQGISKGDDAFGGTKIYFFLDYVLFQNDIANGRVDQKYQELIVLNADPISVVDGELDAVHEPEGLVARTDYPERIYGKFAARMESLATFEPLLSGRAIQARRFELVLSGAGTFSSEDFPYLQGKDIAKILEDRPLKEGEKVGIEKAKEKNLITRYCDTDSLSVAAIFDNQEENRTGRALFLDFEFDSMATNSQISFRNIHESLRDAIQNETKQIEKLTPYFLSRHFYEAPPAVRRA